MKLAALSCLAVLASSPALAGVPPHVGSSLPQPAYRMGDTGRLLATPRPYPANRVDSVRRPGFNGKLWRGETFTNAPMYRPVDTGNPGADLYGAVGEEYQHVYARTGNVVIGLSPWDRFDKEGLGHLERARGQWLRERGYTGGVRTHVNAMHHPVYDAAPVAVTTEDEGAAEASAAPRGKIEPRATITIPSDLPRFKSRMQVDATPARVSRPFGKSDGTVVRFVPSTPECAATDAIASGAPEAASSDVAIARAE